MSDRFEFQRYTPLVNKPTTRRVVYALEVTAKWLEHIRHKWGNAIEIGDYILLKREGGIVVMKPDEFDEQFASLQS